MPAGVRGISRGTSRVTLLSARILDGRSAIELNALAQNAVTTLVAVAWKIAGALALWLAGRVLVLLRPFKVGDFVSAGGVTGTITEIGLFGTTVNTPDNVRTIVGLKERVAKIPNVLATPAPDVDVLQFTPAGPLLCVRPYCSNDNYWQVYFETNRTIRETFGAAGYPAAMPAYAVTGAQAPPPEPVSV
jgi:small conductance mechanosensitive channel